MALSPDFKCAVLLGAISVIALAGIRVGRADPTASAPLAVAPAPPVSAHALNKEDLEAFFDGIIRLQLTRSDVAGASVLVMKDGDRLFEPGKVSAYSNYGVGLGSYIVQRVGGEPFEQYVAEHIFSPLGMTHSTFFQPPSKNLEKLPSEGYPSSTLKAPIGFERFSPVGAGGLSADVIGPIHRL